MDIICNFFAAASKMPFVLFIPVLVPMLFPVIYRAVYGNAPLPINQGSGERLFV
jgi:hypothetical protein